jgi:ABC-type uncharacterized transport system substrate-binding protein
MRRRSFITLLGGAAAAWPVAARAQRSNAVKRVGFLRIGAENDPVIEPRYTVLQQELQKLGWTSGRNLEVDVREAGDDDRLRIYAAELASKAPDVIVVFNTQATAILKQQTSTIPIVFVGVADPVASGFVASFARPGGNVTGFTSVEYSFAGKWLSILKDIAPSFTRLMVLINPANSNWTGFLPTIEVAARSLRVSLNTAAVIAPGNIERAVERFAREPAGGILVLPGAGNREMLAALAAQHRLPAIYPFDYYAEAGGLVSYGSDTLDLFRRAAAYVDRILHGEKPADLPVQAPVKFELVINLKAAKAIGIEVPYNVLILADRVID